MSYNRRYRKAIHILAGFPAFLLKVLTLEQMMLFGVCMLVASWLLRPNWPWLRELAKPEDLDRRYIAGVRHYFVAVLALIVLFGARHSELATAGWLALAWGDGAAGLVGGKVRLPWNPSKTLAGFLACILLIYLAIAASCAWSGAAADWMRWQVQVFIVLVAAAVSVAESLHLPMDDNYIVSLGTASLLYAGTALLHLW